MTVFSGSVPASPPTAGTGCVSGLSFRTPSSSKVKASFDKGRFLSQQVTLNYLPLVSHTLYDFFDEASATVGRHLTIGVDEAWGLAQTPKVYMIANIGGGLTSNPNPLYDFPYWDTTLNSGDAGLLAIIQGTYDTQLKSWATKLGAIGGDCFARLWREPTASGHPWYTSTPQHYIDAWRRVWTVFKGNASAWANFKDNNGTGTNYPITGSPINATNCYFTFATGSDNWWGSDGSAGNAQLLCDAFYPGSAYVDWIGVDGYSPSAFADNSDFATHFKNGPANAQGGTFSWYTWATSKSKPLMVSETGATVDTVNNYDHTWVSSMLAGLQAMPQVRVMVPWAGTSFPVTTSDGARAQVQADYKTLFANSYMMQGGPSIWKAVVTPNGHGIRILAT